MRILLECSIRQRYLTGVNTYWWNDVANSLLVYLLYLSDLFHHYRETRPLRGVFLASVQGTTYKERIMQGVGKSCSLVH